MGSKLHYGEHRTLCLWLGEGMRGGEVVGTRETCDLWRIFQSVPRMGPLLLEIIVF